MVDPWIEEARRMQRETKCLFNVSILKAALSLENKQNEAPDYDTAAVISLLYLVLALRKKRGRPILREHYVSQALMWRREAINLLAQAASANG
jgi:hypothetical protein